MLHLFNLHTQSSYIDSPTRLYVESYVARYEQLKECRDFINERVFNNPSNFDKEKDIVLMVGDFNVNSQ